MRLKSHHHRAMSLSIPLHPIYIFLYEKHTLSRLMLPLLLLLAQILLIPLESLKSRNEDIHVGPAFVQNQTYSVRWSVFCDFPSAGKTASTSVKISVKASL